MHTSAEGFLAPVLSPYIPWLYLESGWWTFFGTLATITFSGRFILQWIHSERARKIVVPALFWHLSFWGSVLQLIYLVHCDKAPLIFGYCFLPFLYGRNLYLLYRHQPIVSPGDSRPE
jgi:lipid-A-disaccharide synthase-like uncharacterized protein